MCNAMQLLMRIDNEFHARNNDNLLKKKLATIRK